jgi:hypothetical protein
MLEQRAFERESIGFIDVKVAVQLTTMKEILWTPRNDLHLMRYLSHHWYLDGCRKQLA